MAEGGSQASLEGSTSRFGTFVGRSSYYDEDPFANFQYTPPKPRSSRFRSFTRPSRYRAISGMPVSSREQLSGSQTNLSSFGSSQDLTLDAGKMMNMAEDARSRKISAEIMKHRLYESVITSPRRRRFSMRADYYGPSQQDETELASFQGAARFVQSLPVTPATSQNVTPAHSPTAKRRFGFGFFSRGTTPDEEESKYLAATEEENGRGLTSLFRPRPRCISAFPQHQETSMETDEDLENRLHDFSSPIVPPPFINNRRMDVDEDQLYLQGVPKRPRPSKSPNQYAVTEKDINAVAPTSF